MTEHEKLATILLEIKYPYFDGKEEPDTYYSFIEGDGIVDDSNRIINVREVIFTPEFKDCLINYLLKSCSIQECEHYVLELFYNNLDNPVDYLHNLIFNNK